LQSLSCEYKRFYRPLFLLQLRTQICLIYRIHKIFNERFEERAKEKTTTDDVFVTLGELRLFSHINTENQLIKDAAETVRENLRDFKHLGDEEIIILDRKKKTFASIRRNIKSATTAVGLASIVNMGAEGGFLAEMVHGISVHSDDAAYYLMHIWPVDLSLDESVASTHNRRVIVATRPEKNVEKFAKTFGASDGIATGIQDIASGGLEGLEISKVIALGIEGYIFLKEKVTKEVVKFATGACSAVD
jgi:hypothetical protein